MTKAADRKVKHRLTILLTFLESVLGTAWRFQFTGVS